MEPLFMKADVEFEIDGRAVKHKSRDVSLFGTAGMPWGWLKPDKDFGREVEVKIQPARPAAPVVHAHATIARDMTVQGTHLGLRFSFEPDQEAELLRLIKKYGFYPSDYIRKYPRIPATVEAGTFPQHAIVNPGATEGLDSEMPLVFDIENLSPNGILLKSDSAFAHELKAGGKLDFTLEPRGWFPVPVKIQGSICRITEEIDPATKNVVRRLGVKFTKIGDSEKIAFRELLQDILLQISKPPSS